MGFAMVSFPDWIDEHIPEDAEFADAFESVSQERRAWLKTAIARLFDWYGHSGGTRVLNRTTWRSGLTARVDRRPRDFALLFVDGAQESPVRALAAVVPALALGVPRVMVARVDGKGPWPGALLAALELAGVETVATLDQSLADSLVLEMCGSGASGLVMGLGPDVRGFLGQCSEFSPRIYSWFSDFGGKAHVWLDSADDFDLDILAFAHPQASFSVWGAKAGLPGQGFESRTGEWADFMNCRPALVYAPAGKPRTGACVEYLPGQEGCWFWPDLYSELFFFQNIGWGADG